MNAELDTIREALRIAYAKGYAQREILAQQERRGKVTISELKTELTDEELDEIWKTALACT